MEINRHGSGGTRYWELHTGRVIDAGEGGIELERILWVEEIRENPQFLKGKNRMGQPSCWSEVSCFGGTADET